MRAAYKTHVLYGCRGTVPRLRSPPCPLGPWRARRDCRKQTKRAFCIIGYAGPGPGCMSRPSCCCGRFRRSSPRSRPPAPRFAHRTKKTACLQTVCTPTPRLRCPVSCAAFVTCVCAVVGVCWGFRPAVYYCTIFMSACQPVWDNFLS